MVSHLRSVRDSKHTTLCENSCSDACKKCESAKNISHFTENLLRDKHNEHKFEGTVEIV